MAKWIKTDGTVVDFDVNPDGNNLDLFQEKVGGYFAPIYLPNKQVMLVNEEGMIHRLPPNRNASMIAHHGGFDQMYPNAINQSNVDNIMYTSILGDAVLLEKGEWK
jgi:flagellar basal body rod protein FlgF